MRARALIVRTGVFLGAAGLALTPHLVSATPGVAPAALAGTIAGVSCSHAPAAGRVVSGGKVRRSPGGGEMDHDRIGRDTLKRVNAQLRRVHKILVAESASSRTADGSARTTGTTTTSAGTTLSSSSRSIASTVYISVYAHNVYGKHAGERDLGSPAIKNAIVWLNNQYAGMESTASVHTRYRFVLRSINLIRNDTWYHAPPGSQTDVNNKRLYHRGTMRDLNLYFREPSSDQGTLLGYSTFPWQIATRLDGVTVHPETLPHRALAGFNQNNTMTHEVGHWLGLLHVFEGGCQDLDGVRDTPAMADGPNVFECKNANTCPEALLQPAVPDPIHNYMDYTPDPCMFMFTKGQAARMDAAWVRYRQ